MLDEKTRIHLKTTHFEQLILKMEKILEDLPHFSSIVYLLHLKNLGTQVNFSNFKIKIRMTKKVMKNLRDLLWSDKNQVFLKKEGRRNQRKRKIISELWLQVQVILIHLDLDRLTILQNMDLILVNLNHLQ